VVIEKQACPPIVYAWLVMETGFSAKLPDHPVMTEYVIPPLFEKRRGIDRWFCFGIVIIKSFSVITPGFVPGQSSVWYVEGSHAKGFAR